MPKRKVPPGPPAFFDEEAVSEFLRERGYDGTAVQRCYAIVCRAIRDLPLRDCDDAAAGIWETATDLAFNGAAGFPPAALAALRSHFVLFTTSVVATHESGDGCTTKSVVELRDSHHVEAVAMRHAKRSTVCVSSQVGCQMGCQFCATGTMGIIGDLTAAEIVEQFAYATLTERLAGRPAPKNVVFMGMGEPLNNVAQVRLAIDLLTDAEALGFSRRAVTISTVAPSSEAVLDMASLSSKMAFSLHSAVDETRKLLVPTMRCTVADLQTAWLSALASRPERYRELIVEMTLINGVNDTPSELAALATWLQVFPAGAILVNLIPMNASPAAPPNWRASSLENARAFQRGLWTHSIRSTIRDQKGDREQAACGQLATNDSRRSASLRP
mmetsp:Transcript_21324/g.72225  ORF Transcript_21324/g.72225 Transcript_21324/m.72225 type:complete len:386 (-) Transcript_21324:333-1490(-)